MCFYSTLKSPRDSPGKPFEFPSLLSWGFLAALLALDFFQSHLSPTLPTHPSAPRGKLDVWCWTSGAQGRLSPPRASVLSPAGTWLWPAWLSVSGEALCPAHELVPRGLRLLSCRLHHPLVRVSSEARAPCPLGRCVR